MVTLLSLVILSSLSPFAKPLVSVYPSLFPFWQSLSFSVLSSKMQSSHYVIKGREVFKMKREKLGGNETEEEMKQTETHTHTQGEIKV